MSAGCPQAREVERLAGAARRAVEAFEAFAVVWKAPPGDPLAAFPMGRARRKVGELRLALADFDAAQERRQ